MALTSPDRTAFRQATPPAHQAPVERLGGRAGQILERIRAIE